MNKILFWTLAVVLTLSAAVYQRLTGPTYPKRISIKIDNVEIKGKLVRSNNTGENATVVLKNVPEEVSATLFYKRFPTNEEFSPQPFERNGSNLEAFLPSQPPAGKLQYYLILEKNGTSVNLFKEDPITIRFKGAVPGIILIPHIIFMFFAMLFSSLAGIFALGKIKSYKMHGWIALGLLTLGGFIFGPIVQYYAFGEAWTGFPFGFDLTDNKTLIAGVIWLGALRLNLKKERPAYIVFAAVALIVVFSIPHSLFGSELNYDNMKVVTGMIMPIFGV
jgi:hypothetical protein